MIGVKTDGDDCGGQEPHHARLFWGLENAPPVGTCNARLLEHRLAAVLGGSDRNSNHLRS